MFGKLLSLFGGKSEYRCLLIGNDASGKTTALYRMRLGETVTTIPTIGFNVETIDVSRASLTLWDVGGCDKIRPLWRHYYQATQAVVFMVDSNDRERLSTHDSNDKWEVTAESGLAALASEEELRGCVVLIFANKQDLPGAMTVDEVTAGLNLDRISGAFGPMRVFPCCALTGDGLYEGFTWLVDAIKNKHSTFTSTSTSTSSLSSSSSTLTSSATIENETPLLIRWLEQEDEPDDVFLQAIQDCNPEVRWDHRDHLRLGWLNLTRHGRREGMRRTFAELRHFIENSPRTLKTKFHETMTYFWIHMIDYAMHATANPSGDFKGFLFMNPQLSNGGLFLDYYSKELMFHNADARIQVVLPDKKPLPSRIDAPAAAQPSATTTKRPAVSVVDCSADDYETAVRDKLFDSWSHVHLVRLIYQRLLPVRLGSVARKPAVDGVVATLRELTGAGFHMTRMGFWIKMVELALASQKTPAGQFADFWSRESKLHDALLHTQYYSPALLADPAAKDNLLPPDVRQIPSVVRPT